LKVHEVGERAAELAGVTRVLEATMPRGWVVRALGAARMFGIGSPNLAAVHTPPGEITRTIDVRRFARQKRAALAAHRSQISGSGRSASLFRILVHLPIPLFALLMGREWYIEARIPAISKETM
jgi:hypothetical protein